MAYINPCLKNPKLRDMDGIIEKLNEYKTKGNCLLLQMKEQNG